MYRLLIFCFSILALLQFLSGGLVYFYKVGFDYPSSLAYHKGTQAAQEILERKIVNPSATSFQKPSFYSLLKIAWAHLAAYALLCFIITHFLRSLYQNANWVNILSQALFVCSILEIATSFVASYGPAYFSLVRLVILYLFILLGSFLCLILLYMSLKT